MKTLKSISLLSGLMAGLFGAAVIADVPPVTGEIVVLKSTKIITQVDRSEVTPTGSTVVTGQPATVKVGTALQYIVLDLKNIRRAVIDVNAAKKICKIYDPSPGIGWNGLPRQGDGRILWFLSETDADASPDMTFQYKNVLEGKGDPFVVRYPDLPSYVLTIKYVPRLLTGYGLYHTLYKNEDYDANGDLVMDGKAVGNTLATWTERVALEVAFSTQANNGRPAPDPVSTTILQSGSLEYGRALVLNRLLAMGYKAGEPGSSF